MLDFEYYSPTRLIVGRGREKEAGRWAMLYGAKKVLLHYGSGSAVKSGLIGRVRASLEAEGLSVVELGGVVANPRDTLVYEGIELCRREGIDFVLPVGGGSVLDSGKAIAIGGLRRRDFWDFYIGRRQPYAVWTRHGYHPDGHRSEASNSSVIKRPANR
jgi:alcohol dehydrogenase YqhD (iron-dependent ADH family)